jgi:hypothetical protein
MAGDVRARVHQRSRGPVVSPHPTPREHITDCDGNGYVDCWHCGGEGWYDDDDAEMYEADCAPQIRCVECNGRGVLTCPGCGP